VTKDAELRRSPPSNVFVGREWELAQLRAALIEAQAGRGQLLVVTGEAGIGKTRLVRKLANLAEDEQTRVLWGRCWEGEEAPPFWPWIQIFRNLVSGEDRRPAADALGQGAPDFTYLMPELREVLAQHADAPPYPPSDQVRFRLFDSATTLVKRAAAVRPLVLILEDLHEGDRSSLLLLEFAARNLA
jgi:predicted ATPase